MDLVAAATTLGDEWSDNGDLLEVAARGHPGWHKDAACKEAPSGVNWFPERGESSEPAKRVCRGCLVRLECAEWAFEQAVTLSGVWGGLSGRDRKRLRQIRPAA